MSDAIYELLLNMEWPSAFVLMTAFICSAYILYRAMATLYLISECFLKELKENNGLYNLVITAMLIPLVYIGVRVIVNMIA